MSKIQITILYLYEWYFEVYFLCFENFYTIQRKYQLTLYINIESKKTWKYQRGDENLILSYKTLR